MTLTKKFGATFKTKNINLFPPNSPQTFQTDIFIPSIKYKIIYKMTKQFKFKIQPYKFPSLYNISIIQPIKNPLNFTLK